MNPFAALGLAALAVLVWNALPSGKSEFRWTAPWPPLGHDDADWIGTGLSGYRPKTYGDGDAVPVAFLVVARKNGGDEWQVVGPRQPISTEEKANALYDAWVKAHPDDNTSISGLLRRT